MTEKECISSLMALLDEKDLVGKIEAIKNNYNL